MENVVRRSKRIYLNNDKIFKNCLIKLHGFIISFAKLDSFKDKVIIMMNIIDEIVLHYDILPNKFMNTLKIIRIKNDDIKNAINKEIANGQQIKLLKKQFESKCELFDNSYFKFTIKLCDFKSQTSNININNNNNNNNECPICIGPITYNNLIVTKCSHYFHKKCLFTYIKKGENENNNCPLCRSVLF